MVSKIQEFPRFTAPPVRPGHPIELCEALLYTPLLNDGMPLASPNIFRLKHAQSGSFNNSQFNRPFRAAHNAKFTMASHVRDLAEDEFQPTSFSSSSLTSHAQPQGTSHEQANRRRKVPDSVTLNACTTCKKARAKVAINQPKSRSPPHLSSPGPSIQSPAPKFAESIRPFLLKDACLVRWSEPSVQEVCGAQPVR